MAEKRQIGKLTIHFLGDKAAQLAKSFDGSLSGSQSFRDAMDETARTQKHIYVGGSLDDLRDQSGFDRAKFDPSSEETQSAFGKSAGADSYFVVVTNKDHHLVQNNGRTFPGTMDLSLVHEFLHPSQIMRTLAETGNFFASDSETRTQMREQKIAKELGKIPGKDFPDVFESGPYGLQLDRAETQRSTAPSDPALPVDPMMYDARTSPNPTEPISLQLDDLSAPRLVRVNGSPSAALTAASAAFSDNQNSWDSRLGSGTSSLGGITPRNSSITASLPEAEAPLGLVSGKPMRFIPLPIFDTRGNSSAASRDWLATLAGLSSDGGKSRDSTLAASGPAAPFVFGRQNTSGNGDSVNPPVGNPGDALAPPPSTSPAAQGPLSLNDAFLLYRKRLDAANPSQPVATNSGTPAAPLTPSGDTNVSGGLLGRLAALMGVDPQNPDQPATPEQDDMLRAFYRDPERPWTLQRFG